MLAIRMATGKSEERMKKSPDWWKAVSGNDEWRGLYFLQGTAQKRNTACSKKGFWSLLAGIKNFQNWSLGSKFSGSQNELRKICSNLIKVEQSEMVIP